MKIRSIGVLLGVGMSHLGLLFRDSITALLSWAADDPAGFPLLFHQEGRITLRTFFRDGLIPEGVGTIRVPAAAVKCPSLPGSTFYQGTLAPFLGTPDPRIPRLREFTGRIIGAGQKFSEFPILYDHWTAA